MLETLNHRVITSTKRRLFLGALIEVLCWQASAKRSTLVSKQFMKKLEAGQSLISQARDLASRDSGLFNVPNT